MGSWGSGVWQNDAVRDWLLDLNEHAGRETVLAPFRAAELATPAEIEIVGWVGDEVLGAVEIMLAASGDIAEDFPEEAREWVQLHRPRFGLGSVDLAQRAARRVGQDYETRYIEPSTPQFQEAFVAHCERYGKSWARVKTGSEDSYDPSAAVEPRILAQWERFVEHRRERYAVIRAVEARLARLAERLRAAEGDDFRPRKTVLASLTPAAFANAMNLVYTVYVVPFSMTQRSAEAHVSANSIRLDRSPLWLNEAGDVVALACLGVRGDRGWIGGFGIAPPYRVRGYARELALDTLATARELGLREVSLEVITTNTAAIRTYTGVGFTHRRDLIVFRREADVPPPEVNDEPAPATLAEYLQRHDPAGRIRPVNPATPLLTHPGLQPSGPAWQNEPDTLRTIADVQALVLGPADDPTAFVLYGASPHSVRVFDLVCTQTEAAQTLLTALAGAYPGRAMSCTNEPADSAACAAFSATGWQEYLRQHEMVYTVPGENDGSPR